jgi:hypothetical protein
MSRWKDGYKVVALAWLKDNTPAYKSLVITTDKGGVVYVPHKITKPQKGGGPLCVFTSKERAIIYCTWHGMPISYVKRIRYVPSKRQYVWVPRHISQGGRTPLSALSKGTVLATQVLLLEGKA